MGMRDYGVGTFIANEMDRAQRRKRYRFYCR
jgi:hypothetical protein